MDNLILAVNIISAVLLVFAVLLQKSEGGALGIGASQDSLISSRSAGNFLTKTTAVLAAIFIVTSVILTILSRDKMPTTSVLEKIEENQDMSEPEIPKSD